MNSRFTKLSLGLVSLIVPIKFGLSAEPTNHSSNTKNCEIGHSQIEHAQPQGIFNKTHENCIPNKSFRKKVRIEASGKVYKISDGQESLLSELRWTGFEGFSKSINEASIKHEGVEGCKAIYCRPVNIPGGKALWISYLPEVGSRVPILDELYAYEGEA